MNRLHHPNNPRPESREVTEPPAAYEITTDPVTQQAKIHLGTDEKVNITDIHVTVTGADGKKITESVTDYTRNCVNKQYTTLNDFLRRWTEADKKQAIIQELAQQGVFWPELQQTVSQKLGYELDPFDLICHIVAWPAAVISKRTRRQC